MPKLAAHRYEGDLKGSAFDPVEKASFFEARAGTTQLVRFPLHCHTGEDGSQSAANLVQVWIWYSGP